MTSILIVDDDPVQLRLTSNIAEKDGFDILTAQDGEEAITQLRDHPETDAVILDLVMPELDGLGVMREMERINIQCPVIVQTASASLDTVTTAMRLGAIDFFVKPVAPERLLISLRNALKMSRLENCVKIQTNRQTGKLSRTDIITASPAMDRVLELTGKAARSDIPVLIEGESGTGKEVVARAIQGMSKRAGKPFVIVNCGAIPPDLVESTLFGHLKGAFTGAVSDQKGKFSEAEGGTIFLDEIGELPLAAQVGLLRVLQTGEIETVGAGGTKRVNVRVISATNRRLLNLTREKRFREDLFYRLNVFPLYIPPLRDRIEDIEPLADHFMARLAPEVGRKISGLAPQSLELLKSYDWPGNVRQLENAIYRAIVLNESGLLSPVDFPQIVAGTASRDTAHKQIAAQPLAPFPVHVDDPIKAPETPANGSASITETNAGGQPDRFVTAKGQPKSLQDTEKELILFTLQHHRGKMTRVARSLGIGRSTLYRKIREYGLEKDQTYPSDYTSKNNAA